MGDGQQVLAPGLALHTLSPEALGLVRHGGQASQWNARLSRFPDLAANPFCRDFN